MSDTFVVKDSGKRTEFETGSRRDTEDDKPDFTLLPWVALARFAFHLMKGAVKYGRKNWEKGQSMSRAERSLGRHYAGYLAGDRSEDHLSAIMFNAGLLIDHEERIARGELPASLDDRDECRRTARPVVVEFHDAAGANLEPSRLAAWS